MFVVLCSFIPPCAFIIRFTSFTLHLFFSFYFLPLSYILSLPVYYSTIISLIIVTLCSLFSLCLFFFFYAPRAQHLLLCIRSKCIVYHNRLALVTCPEEESSPSILFQFIFWSKRSKKDIKEMDGAPKT